MPRLCVVGLSHKTAPVEVRERVAFAETAIEPVLRGISTEHGVGEAMVVSTCNRVELYAGVDGDDAPEVLRHVLVEARSLPSSLRAHLYLHEGEAALRHLFRVTASLDSMVVGESQILGQIKQAYSLALELGTVGPLLQRTVPRAFSLAKRVRSETDVARSAASISSAAVDLAAQIFGELRGRAVLVVGAGKMGDLAARHLRSAGISELYVVNRTRARAEELAARMGGLAANWEELERLLGKVDIVLCSTGAATPVIDAALVERAMRARRGRWLFFIDIAVPRDVDPRVGRLENVYLYDVDALHQVVDQNLQDRGRHADVAEAMVEEELRRFYQAERTQGVVPLIKALRERFHAVARAEAERAMGRLQLASDKDRAQLIQLAEGIANKLLHDPLTALKRGIADDGTGDGLPETVRRLFALEDPGDEPEVENVIPLKAKDRGGDR